MACLYRVKKDEKYSESTSKSRSIGMNMTQQVLKTALKLVKNNHGNNTRRYSH
jgi:hypothetical protein